MKLYQSKHKTDGRRKKGNKTKVFKLNTITSRLVSYFMEWKILCKQFDPHYYFYVDVILEVLDMGKTSWG